MFRVFPFSISGTFNFNNLDQFASGIGGVFFSVLETIDIDELSRQYQEAVSNIYNELDGEEEYNADFINFEEYNDMYLLIINMYGINIRELSIMYDSNIIEITALRTEIKNTSNFIGFNNNTFVKKQYKKKFENIEDIDVSRLIKSIDNGIYKISMPKKYIIDNVIDIEDISYYEEPIVIKDVTN